MTLIVCIVLSGIAGGAMSSADADLWHGLKRMLRSVIGMCACSSDHTDLAAGVGAAAR